MRIKRRKEKGEEEEEEGLEEEEKERGREGGKKGGKEGRSNLKVNNLYLACTPVQKSPCLVQMTRRVKRTPPSLILTHPSHSNLTHTLFTLTHPPPSP